MTKLHTIIGANGAIGRATLQAAQQANLPVRAVNRTTPHPEVTTIIGDMRRPDDADRAIAESSHVYLCLGLPYRSKIWQRDWPLIMEHAIRACAKNGAALIFFDNAYMYGPPPLPVPFDEQTPQKPVTSKGQTRQKTAQLMEKAMAEGIIQGVIGRSADFYGEAAVNSPLYISFLQRMLSGKAPQSLGKPQVPHTYAHTGTNGRALIALAQAPDTWGQVWHLPVDRPITFEEVAALINQELGTNHTVQFLSPTLQKLLSLFMRSLSEVREMNDQFTQPYHMDDRKFRNRFPKFHSTPYEKGIPQMVAYFRDTDHPAKSNL